MTTELYKDEVLDQIANDVNVAQFVSYNPNLEQRFARLYGMEPNHEFESPIDAIHTLFKLSNDNSLNIRTYFPGSHQSQPFVYGLKDAYEVLKNLVSLSEKGLYCIVHETVNVDDGGVSGVLQNGILEFAPGSTVRFIEHASDPISVFSRKFGTKLLKTVYGFSPDFNYPDTKRVEFSLHPHKIGYLKSHTLVWEIHDVPACAIKEHYIWPTAFSRLLGDKAYGLLMADLLGFNVPYTEAYVRHPHVNNFSFGTVTNQKIQWMRTCPSVQDPGKYTTVRGWQDPLELMNTDDPSGEIIASCLCQDEVLAEYSGASLTTAGNNIPIIEGVKGFGDNFMLGTNEPIELPYHIIRSVYTLHQCLVDIFGPVRFEWVHDGIKVWILQLHVGVTQSLGRIIVPGDFTNKLTFDSRLGLDHLKAIIKSVSDGDTGIIVRGNVGMASHVCDVLRKSGIPSYLE